MSDSTPGTEPAIRYWDDVVVGETLAGFSIHLDWTAMALQVHGSQDWNQIHHDPDFARDSGHAGIFYNTGWTAGLLGRTLTDWAGVYGWVCKLSFQMRGMNMHDDTVSTRGAVTKKYIDKDGRHLVEVEVWLENDRVGKTTPASAIVQLPRASS
ncbi:MAG: MaoC/PaaZ C-terminal domain-containing protein [Pseudomonadales bacterium]|jgi:acyl dehydratase|nr:MaoC/PaaZ C-terminal domain-containing protein [Pseudomonadales bacterium]MDP6469729.1 MaoC/PaaZ C-terminal domain-containing protein [Pseudomonadales bacterium]MDP6827670.1 MaoC/PaaZ C-terminal domain-containing protein [Pseudomonadales bacterium]MDP6971890.1 MaoC/PaaZ C-terminal domain-containing protein [Pseudomonadales bacterium]|tara:strand:- start:8958 stop:9419 length:462 start_codon:yes stop_codon:yes gene_type:complete